YPLFLDRSPAAHQERDERTIICILYGKYCILGYTAHVESTFAYQNNQLIKFKIVGPYHPEYVESRIEKFIESL
uniref:Uncharacterized protein n=1 Tax=Romanomermis culicivorax TaxID=13658 RepID=A0A915ITW5_ROMCU